MRHLDDPALGSLPGIAFELPGFLSSSFHMGNVTVLLNDFQSRRAGVACVGTQVLAPPLRWLGALDHNRLQHGPQLRDVMPVGSGHDERQRDATTVHQQMTFAAIFFPDPLGWDQRLTEPAALSSSRHQYFASAKRSLRDRHTLPSLPAKELQKAPLFPIAEIEHELRSRCHTARQATPSTGTRFSKHTRCLQKPNEGLWACDPHQPCERMSGFPTAAGRESGAQRASKNRLLLPMTSLLPSHSSTRSSRTRSDYPLFTDTF